MSHAEASATTNMKLEKAVAAVHSHLEDDTELRLPRDPDLGSVRGFVTLVDRCVELLNRALDLDEDRSSLIRQSTLQGSFPVLYCYRHGRTRLAADLLLAEWKRQTETFGGREESLGFRMEEPGALEMLAPLEAAEARELMATLNTVVFELLRDSESQVQGRGILRRLMGLLSLSFDELGRLLGVSGETVRRWERGSHRVPDERMAQLDQAGAALERLVEVFRPERLARVLRRAADLFRGETALDWILRGRISDVADRYEAALTYQA
jgi:transcriptional regulator with XRE-family HTH domain